MLMLPHIDASSTTGATTGRSRRAEASAGAEAAPRVERVERIEEERRWNGQERRRDPRRRASWAPHAPLVAQLIATALGLAQTRAKRRAAIEQALAAYRRTEAEPTSRGLA